MSATGRTFFQKGLIATDINFIAIEQLDRPYPVKVKIRLNHEETAATLFPHAKNSVRVIFNEPQMAVAPGQSAVFYSDDTVIGGGVIEQAL